MADPSLREYRESSLAVILWDDARARVVWANPAGVRLFDAHSLFDLIGRAIDPDEPGLALVRDLKSKLEDGVGLTAELTFPSFGIEASVACTLMRYGLADGRSGVLMVEQARALPAAASRGGLHGAEAALDVLPVPVIVYNRDGIGVYLNRAGEAFLPPGAIPAADVLLENLRLQVPFQRLHTSHLVSKSGTAKTRFGLRDVTVTLARIDEHDTLYATATIEDITARLALEQRLDEVPGDKETAAQVDSDTAFRKVGQSILDDMAGRTQRAATAVQSAPAPGTGPEPTPEPPKPLATANGRQIHIPESIKHAIERSGEAVVIMRGDAMVFATEKVSQLFGFPTAQAALDNGDFTRSLVGLSGSQEACRIVGSDGRDVTADVVVTSIPWLDGPARQFRIKPSRAVRGNGSGTSSSAERSRISLLPPLDGGIVRAANDDRASETDSDVRVDTVSQATPVQGDVPLLTSFDQMRKQAATLSRNGANPAGTMTAFEEIQAIMDVVTDGIVTLDKDRRILSFSAGAEAIFGRTLANVIGTPFKALLAPQSEDIFENYAASLQQPGIAAVFNDGREVLAQVATPDGTTGTTPLFLTLGKLSLQHSDADLCAVVRDITQFKRSEVELKTAKDEAEQVSKRKSEFLSRIGHELRTPINSILGFSDIMRQDQGAGLKREKVSGYAQDIHVSATHLLSLIDDLLDLSKVEAGRMDMDFTAVSIPDVTHYALRMLEKEAAERNIVLRMAMPERLPRVVADQRAMRQILINLLSNAVTYTNEGGEVTVSAQTARTGQLKLKISDTGIGMSEAELEQAIEPFKRVRTEGRETKGTGLGLPLTKALVEANRASFDITSRRGEGTVIEITFPTTRVLAD
jgi:PAS domain S-box-containing protein